MTHELIWSIRYNAGQRRYNAFLFLWAIRHRSGQDAMTSADIRYNGIGNCKKHTPLTLRLHMLHWTADLNQRVPSTYILTTAGWLFMDS